MIVDSMHTFAIELVYVNAILDTSQMVQMKRASELWGLNVSMMAIVLFVLIVKITKFVPAKGNIQ